MALREKFRGAIKRKFYIDKVTFIQSVSQFTERQRVLKIVGSKSYEPSVFRLHRPIKKAKHLNFQNSIREKVSFLPFFKPKLTYKK